MAQVRGRTRSASARVQATVEEKCRAQVPVRQVESGLDQSRVGAQGLVWATGPVLEMWGLMLRQQQAVR